MRATLRGSLRGSRLTLFPLCGGFLRLFCAGQFVAIAARFFHIAAFLKAMEDAGEEAPAVMLQLHAVGDLANAGGFGESGKVRENKLRTHFGRARFFLGIVGVALIRNAHEVSIGCRIWRQAQRIER